MPYTLAFLTRPKSGMSEEEFLRHYTQVHRPLAEKLPGLLAYRQTRILKEGYRARYAVDFTAYSEYTFDSEDDAERAWASAEAKALDDDAQLFMAWASVLTMPLAELGTFTARSEHRAV